MWLDTDDNRESCVEDASSTVQLLPPGAIVIARGERWRVHACLGHADCAEIHLANAARSTVLLAPIDRFRLVESESRVRAVRLRQWAAWLREYATRYRAEGLRVDHVRARVLPYQLAPALAAAAGHARLLLADEVGLGKTIQAGWIVADAIGRNADARILIVVPAGLKRQWHAELLLHFGIDALVSDARWLRRTATELPGDINPWSLPGVYLTSLDFIKRSDVVRSLDHHVWDVLAVDEVHTAASPTDRFRALRVLARRARCVVMISATPFSGDQQSLASIAGLGAAPDDRPPLMFRRSREDAAVTGRRRHRFGVVTISRAERRVQRLLERYSRLVWRHAPGDPDPVRLAMTVLRKRALSSPIAARRSLDRRLRFLESAAPMPAQLTLFDTDEDPLDDEEPRGVLATPGMHDLDLERRWLVALIDAARYASRFDSKLSFLRRLMRRVRDDSAIVFTEYRDTLTHLASAFPDALLLHGGLVGRRARGRAETIQSDRRPPARHRCRGRRAQPAGSLPVGRQLRAAMESGTPRTADRARRSHRPAKASACAHAGGPRHGRAARPRAPHPPPSSCCRDARRARSSDDVPRRGADRGTDHRRHPC